MKTRTSYLALNLSVLLFGFAGLFGKWIDQPALMITFGRVFFASITLLIILTFKKSNFRLYDKKDYYFSVISGILLAFHWYAFFKSIQLSTVGIALFSYSTFPVFTSLLEPLTFREKFKISSVFLALLAFSGVYLMIPDFDFSVSATQGIFWGILSGLSFAFVSLINRQLTQKNEAILISVYLMGIATVCLCPVILVFPSTLNLKSLILLILLGIVFTALAHTLFVSSLKHLKAAYASLTAALEPVYGLVFAFFLLNERPTLTTLSGGAIILLAVILASQLKNYSS